MPFVYDEANFLTNQKCFIITGQNIMAHHWYCYQCQRSTDIHKPHLCLVVMGDMLTNKAKTSDNAQQQSASNAVSIFYSVF